MPKGIPRIPRPPRHDPAVLAETLANKLASGNPHLRNDPKLGPVTEKDRVALQRICGETVEAFNARITEKLRIIEDLAAERAIQKLESNDFKASELGFILSVAHDKRTQIDGSSQLKNASLNAQINNFYGLSKDALLDLLDGRKPINITPNEAQPPPTP